MKTVIVSINSKYVHSSLAPWYLLSAVRAYTKTKQDITVQEFTINQDLQMIADHLIATKADVFAICTYIWNVKTVQALVPMLRQSLPNCCVVLGGPEASFCSAKRLDDCMADYISIGEGEESFPQLLDCIARSELPVHVSGVCFKTENGLVTNPPTPLTVDPPDPYSTEYFDVLNGRIAYIEGSRGCPFSCAFCLSGREDHLRLFAIERVKKDIVRLANSGAKTIKFVDRTFNCHKQRCKELLIFMLQSYGDQIPTDVCFHFEVAADLFDDELLSLLATAPKGFFQLEVGLQSFHADTLSAVTRKTDLARLCDNVRRILSGGNIHLHIDLIAGLPMEDWEMFRQSFDTAYALQPHMLQLGFLKLLHGSALRNQAAEHEYVFYDEVPYEVKQTRWLKADELLRLHQVEDVVERLYNSGRFLWTLQYVLSCSGLQPFDVFLAMALHLIERHIDTNGITLDAYTEAVLECFGNMQGVDTARLLDAMTCDSLASKQLNRLPACLAQTDKRIAKLKRVLSRGDIHPTKRGVALLRSQKGKAAVVTYTNRDPVTGRYPLKLVSIAEFE